MDPSMAGNKIIIEHGGPASLQDRTREHFDCYVDARSAGEVRANGVQLLTKATFIQPSISGQQEIEFEIVVRRVSVWRAQYSSFTAAISSAQEQSFEFRT